MNDENKSNFNIAAKGTEEQKRRHEDERQRLKILKIKDDAEKQRLNEHAYQRDATIAMRQEEYAIRREKLAQYMIDRRLPPHPELNLRPDGMRDLSDHERQRAIRKFVDSKYVPEHAKKVEELRKEINKELNGQIDEVLEMEMAQDQKRSPEPKREDPAIPEAKAKLEKLRENSRDITARLERPRGLGRGRSR